MIGIILGVLLLAGVAWLVAGLEREREHLDREGEALREWRARRAKAAAELKQSTPSDGRKW